MNLHRRLGTATLGRTTARRRSLLVYLGLAEELMHLAWRTCLLSHSSAMRVIQALFCSRKLLPRLPHHRASPYNPHSRV